MFVSNLLYVLINRLYTMQWNQFLHSSRFVSFWWLSWFFHNAIPCKLHWKWTLISLWKSWCFILQSLKKTMNISLQKRWFKGRIRVYQVYMKIYHDRQDDFNLYYSGCLPEYWCKIVQLDRISETNWYNLFMQLNEVRLCLSVPGYLFFPTFFPIKSHFETFQNSLLVSPYYNTQTCTLCPLL